VIDTRGIYFDATQPSDLEVLLQTESFSDSLLSRATLLRDRIVDAGITKYNVGNAAWKRPPGIARVILVPGQVESDASLKFGAPGVNTNLGLLQAVRNANPDSYVLYKPHPDVTAGLRRRSRADKAIGKWCDEVVDVDMGTLLLQVDEVHTMTSLTGFEALLRGKVVKCYGQPFYAGWGLTIDVMQPKRRTRRLLLDELIAGSLILYPRYVSLQSGVLTTPERALDDLVAWRVSAPSENRWWRSVTRLMLRMVAT
jgi:capsular polysaccharide export protein